MNNVTSKPAPKGMTATLKRLKQLDKTRTKTKSTLDEAMATLAPIREQLQTLDDEIATDRERIRKHVASHDVRRYQSEYGMVEKINGRPSVTAVDLDILDEVFIKKEADKAAILKAFKACDNTPPTGTTIEYGEPSIRISF